MGIFWAPLPGHSHPLRGCFNHPISISWLCLHWLFKYSSTQVVLPKEKEGDGLTVLSFTEEALWERAVEDHHLSSLVLLSVPAASSHTNRDETLQTEEALGFSVALRQLHIITQAKSELEWELLLEWEELGQKQENQQARMAKKQEDQRARMAEQGDTTFMEVLSQVIQARFGKASPMVSLHHCQSWCSFHMLSE